MKTMSRAHITLALLPSLVGSVAYAAAPANTISAIQVEEGSSTRVVIQGSKEPTFTVFRLGNPPRVVVDLAGADVTHAHAPADSTQPNAPVSMVTTTQFKDAANPIGRVVVALSRDVPFDVKAEGNNVVVALAAGTTPPVKQAAAPAAQPVLAAAVEPASDVVVLEKPATSPAATRLLGIETSMRAGAPVLSLRTNGTVEKYEVQEVKNPTRLVVDLMGVSSAPKKAPALKKGPLSRVRIGNHTTHVRVVLDARGDTLPPFDVASSEDGITVAFSTAPALTEVASAQEPAAPAQEAAAPAPVPEAAPVAQLAAAPVAPAAPARSQVEDIKFDEKGGFYRLRIALKGDADHRVTVDNPRLKVLEIANADLPRSLERSLDTTAFEGPVQAVATFRDPDQPGVVKIAVDLQAGVEHRLWKKGDALYWDFRAQDPKPASAAGGQEVAASSQETRTAGFAVETATLAQEGTPAQDSRYSGKKITIDLKDADILNVLRLIADVSKLNIIAADDVKGTVTIKLRNVPWDQALDIILKVKQLGKERNGNIIRVAPSTTLRAEKEALDAARARNVAVEPTRVKLLPVNYASAGEMLPQVSALLSPRGKATVDARTNVMIVEDIPENIVQAERLVRTLDTQTPQVLIEGRIVEATSNYQRSLGIQWGYALNMSEANGNPTGLVFPYNFGTAGGADPTTVSAATPGVPSPTNWAVNMPAGNPTADNNNTALGFTFGSIGNILNLNLRLTAAEADGVIKIVSSPKIATLDNKTAKISQGVDVPVARVSAAGVSTQLITSALELEVTPHVTADGSVLMKLKITNNAPDFGNVVGGIPSFSKKEANTEVMVRDGETTVVGGIYTRSVTENYRRSPFMGSLPVIGWLFKAQDKRDERKELLTFITPRIVNRQAAAVSPTDLKSR